MHLFIIQPFISHYFPVFQYAMELQNSGQRVVFTGTSSMETVITDAGFEFYEFGYLSEYIIKDHRVFLGIGLKSLVSDSFYEQRTRDFQIAYQNTVKLLKRYNPDTVYIDQSLAEYYFFVKPYVSNIIILHTKFFSGKLKGIPPLTSYYIPNGKYVSRFVVEYLWIRELLKQRIQRIIHKMAFLGKDEVYFWRQHCQHIGIAWRKTVDFKHSLNRGIKGVKNIVFAPRFLEFDIFESPPHLSFSEEPYLKSEKMFQSSPYDQLKQRCLGTPDLNVIYVSFGTVAGSPLKVLRLLEDIQKIVSHFNNTILVVSTGGLKLNFEASTDTYLFNFVPQQDLLRFCTLFITHGGLGSIKEAYNNKVPMLVVPLNQKSDQPGNAARIKSKGLGDYIKIDNYTIQELEEKLSDQMLRSLEQTSFDKLLA